MYWVEMYFDPQGHGFDPRQSSLAISYLIGLTANSTDMEQAYYIILSVYLSLNQKWIVLRREELSLIHPSLHFNISLH